MSRPRAVITRVDIVDDVIRGLQELGRTQVLVGIPSDTANRKDDAPLTNAAIGYLMENGIPERNVPARPFLQPTIWAIRGKLAAYAKKTFRKVMDAPQANRAALVQHGLVQIGEMAVGAVRLKITDGPFAPLSPKTVARRHKQRQNKTLRAGEKKYLALVAGGMDGGEAQDAAGIRPLVNTRELLNSVSFVLRKAR